MGNRCKVIKKRRSAKKTIVICCCVLAVIIAAVSIFISNNVNPMIVLISREKIRALTYDAVANAVLNVMTTINDEELMTITRDNNDDIKNVTINTQKINDLAQNITIAAQKNINTIGEDGIKIPVGSLSGVTLFTGLGPNINIKIYLVGSTRTQIQSVFSESGINQTLHRLLFNIDGSIAIAVPGLPSTINTTTQVVMCETIIIGEVPPTYLNAANVGDMLDLVVD